MCSPVSTDKCQSVTLLQKEELLNMTDESLQQQQQGETTEWEKTQQTEHNILAGPEWRRAASLPPKHLLIPSENILLGDADVIHP